MATLTHLPHVLDVESGYNRYDPNHSSVFEVYITLPTALDIEQADEVLLTEQVTKVDGLDNLQKDAVSGSQKFFGVDVSFKNPTLESTRAEFTIEFNLNLRNVTDNFVLRIFKLWKNLNYNLADGTRTLKADYIADNIRISEANRDGTIWRSILFHDVLLESITGIDTLDYSDNEARKLQVKFISDYWSEDMGSPTGSIEDGKIDVPSEIKSSFHAGNSIQGHAASSFRHFKSVDTDLTPETNG